MSHSYLPLTSHKGEIALSVGVELSFLDESSQREVLEQCAINDCTPSYSQAWRMHKADREGASTKATIQTVMSEKKANQRETVKVPISRLRGVFRKGWMRRNQKILSSRLAIIIANISSASAIGMKDEEVSLWNNSFKNIRIINFLKTMPTRIFI